MSKIVGSPYDGSQQRTGCGNMLVSNMRKEVWGAGVCLHTRISVIVHTAGVCLHTRVSVVVHTAGVCLHAGVSVVVHTAGVCLHAGISVLCTLLGCAYTLGLVCCAHCSQSGLGEVIGSLCSGQPSGPLSAEFNRTPICDVLKRCRAVALAKVPPVGGPFSGHFLHIFRSLVLFQGPNACAQLLSQSIPVAQL